MKGKQLVLLLLILALVGGAGYILFKENRASWSEKAIGSGNKILTFAETHPQAINDVVRVTIKSPSSELNLVKKDDVWTVQERADYPANFEQVSDLIRKLWELKSVQAVKVGPSQFSRLDLVEPGKEGAAGTVIELKDKDSKTLTALLVGKKYMRKSDGMGGMGDMGGFPAGRYVMPVGDPAKVALVSDSFDEIEGKPERWLKKDFFKIENTKSISLEGQTEPQHWTLTKENATAEWKLKDAKDDEKVDASKVSSLGTLFSFASFNDVLAPDAKPEETGLDKPSTVTIETFDNFKYVLRIGKLNGENYPVMVSVSADLVKERQPGKDEKPEDKTKLDEEFAKKLKGFEDKLAAEKKFEQRPYLIAKYTIEQLLKDRSALLAEKKPETPPAGTPPTPGTPPGTPPTSSSSPAKPAPVTVTTPPITVTTPPVAAPPAPKPGTPKPKIEAVTPPVTVPPDAKPAPTPQKPGVPSTEKRAAEKSAKSAGEKAATPPANSPPIPEPLKPETLKAQPQKPESPKPTPDEKPEKPVPEPDKGN
jgi:Domain of unknown function (DUF4340)